MLKKIFVLNVIFFGFSYFLFGVTTIVGTDVTPHTGEWLNYTSLGEINFLIREGNYLWCTNNGGVIKWNLTNNTYIQYNTEHGLINNGVREIAIDSQGNKWFGTSNGASKFDGITWINYTTLDGLSNNNICSMAIDAQDNKWFFTYANTVSKLDGAIWTSYIYPQGPIAGYGAMAIDAQDNKWFGSDGGIITRYDGTNWTTYRPYDILGFPCTFIDSIVVDSYNNKWFGTEIGLIKYDDINWITYYSSVCFAGCNISGHHSLAIVYSVQSIH